MRALLPGEATPQRLDSSLQDECLLSIGLEEGAPCLWPPLVLPARESVHTLVRRGLRAGRVVRMFTGGLRTTPGAHTAPCGHRNLGHAATGGL